MNIYGPSSVHGAHSPRGPQAPRPASPQASRPSATPQDQLDISAAGEAAAAGETGEVRADLVARVRNEIAAGTYETPEKLDAALDRILDQLG